MESVEHAYLFQDVKDKFDSVLTTYENETFTSSTWRYLEGFTLGKWHGCYRENDSQRQKLYDAERKFENKVKDDLESFTDLSEIQSYYDYLFSLKSYQRRFNLDDIDVYFKKENARRSSHYYHRHGANRIRFAKTGSVSELTLLHELAHGLACPPHAGHGRLFASVLLWLVGSRVGQDARKALLEKYREYNVKYSPLRSVKVFEDKQELMERV